MTKQVHSLEETIYDINTQSKLGTNHSANLYLSFVTNKILKVFNEALFIGRL